MKRAIFFLQILIVMFLTETTTFAHEILVNTQDGETFVLDIDPTESFGNLQDKIAALSNGNTQDLLIEFSTVGKPMDFNFEAHTKGGYLGYPRSYSSEVTPEEKNDIRYIVTTLANKSLIAIALAKSDLEAAGDRIDHIHPLRFLMTVFSDEELKVGIRNIRGRGWIWSHFVGGLKESLSTEARIDNMRNEFVYHFAQSVKIDSKIIIPPVSQQKWEEFVDLLITHIPRAGDHDRYDTKTFK